MPKQLNKVDNMDMDKIYSEVVDKFVELPRLPVHMEGESPTREAMVNSLEMMEDCSKIVEIESKSWHDFWVVHRHLVRAMWLALTWIVKQIDKQGK